MMPLVAGRAPVRTVEWPGQVSVAAATQVNTNGLDNAWTYPFGLGTPAATVAMQARRYMHDFGATSEDFGRVAVADRRHAATNPNAATSSFYIIGGVQGRQYPLSAEPDSFFREAREAGAGRVPRRSVPGRAPVCSPSSNVTAPAFTVMR